MLFKQGRFLSTKKPTKFLTRRHVPRRCLAARFTCASRNGGVLVTRPGSFFFAPARDLQVSDRPECLAIHRVRRESVGPRERRRGVHAPCCPVRVADPSATSGPRRCQEPATGTRKCVEVPPPPVPGRRLDALRHGLGGGRRWGPGPRGPLPPGRPALRLAVRGGPGLHAATGLMASGLPWGRSRA